MEGTNNPKAFVPSKEGAEKAIKAKKPLTNEAKRSKSPKPSYGIPKAVANRMARRLVITSGIPTISGMGVFVLSYVLVTKGIADIPPGITLLTSAGCFLIGLVGLSFGILSASWDEKPGSLLGIENIPLNIKRAKAAFKPASQNYEDEN